ncbi:alkaline phosphatase family protein [Azospirillum halopraeferens]|uniref:alkaline phosphatase family protein n=1 Tax=Azospirillum halopraeferens TaxID=34010 RepID=UPI000409E521|nr:alkaline phosphatase family protein [Azospirillum halopraeferens]
MARTFGEPKVILGPVLYFRGEQGDRWRLSALFVLEGEAEPDDLTVESVSLPVPPRHLASWRGRHLWRFDFAVPRAAGDEAVAYGFAEGERWRVIVPGLESPLRVAFTSCNGAEDPATLDRHGTARNALWADLLERHGSGPFHLLIQGGDQLYADRVWHDRPALAEWRRRPPTRLAEPFSAAMAEQAMDHYFDLYLDTWGQPEVAAALARIPSVMMWDDHDIYDGWGSLPTEELAAPVARGVFMVARRCFALFQLGAAPEALPDCVWGQETGAFTQGFVVGDVGILAPDLRSERTPDRVMAPRSRKALPGWLDRFAACRHLLLVSSVPLLFTDTGGVERLLAALPGRHRYADDLRDQWRSPAHAAEWRRLLETLTAFSLRTGCRITAVSGEIHLGALAVLSGPVEIHQLIASGIVHPPPSRLYAAALDRLARRRERPVAGFTLEMPPFAETGRRLIRARNWLALAFESRGGLRAQWHTEESPGLYLRQIA